MAEQAAPRVLDPAGVVVSDPDIAGGEPIFRGTRVPVATLFEQHRGGHRPRRDSRRLPDSRPHRRADLAARGAQPRCRPGAAPRGRMIRRRVLLDEKLPVRTRSRLGRTEYDRRAGRLHGTDRRGTDPARQREFSACRSLLSGASARFRAVNLPEWRHEVSYVVNSYATAKKALKQSLRRSAGAVRLALGVKLDAVHLSAQLDDLDEASKTAQFACSMQQLSSLPPISITGSSIGFVFAPDRRKSTLRPLSLRPLSRCIRVIMRTKHTTEAIHCQAH